MGELNHYKIDDNKMLAKSTQGLHKFITEDEPAKNTLSNRSI